MASVRFTKAEREWIRALIAGHAPEARLAVSVLEKLERSELVRAKVREPGLGWRPAYEVMRAVLGPRLVLPPNLTGEWIGRVSARIRVLGLTEDLCRTLARNVSSWRGPISFERVVMGADRYLASDVQGPGPTGGPLPMEEL